MLAAWILMLFLLLPRFTVPARAFPTTISIRVSTSRRLESSIMASSNANIEDYSSVRIVAPAKKERVGKVLFLHGWAQNARVFQSKSKGLTKKLNQAGYDVVFLEGPHVLPPLTSNDDASSDSNDTITDNDDDNSHNTTPPQNEMGRDNARGWFLLNKDNPRDVSLSQSGIPMTYHGIDESLRLVQQELQRNDDDYCAILGFSQGGVFAHVLMVLAMQATPNNVFARIKCAVIASGFPAQHVSTEDSPFPLGNLATVKVTLPSMHLIGELDTSVRPELSMQLVKLCKDCDVMLHEKGHILPQKSAQCAELIAFLNRHRTS